MASRDLKAYHNPNLSQNIQDRVKAIAAAITQVCAFEGSALLPTRLTVV